MKVSIITVCFNSASTIKETIESVLKQDYPDIEYIIVDGKSTDDTMSVIDNYNNSIASIISEKDNGMYDAINKGINRATGNIIGLLNSDDYFCTNNAVSTIVEAFYKSGAGAVFADVAFVKRFVTNKIVRNYSSKKFVISKFRLGYMPAHPTFYVKRECYENYGLYKTDYKITADFELVMRFLYTYRVPYFYINQTLIYMQAGGVSNQNFMSRYILNKEIVRSCRENDVRTNIMLISLKYFKKIFEFITPKFRKFR